MHIWCGLIIIAKPSHCELVSDKETSAVCWPLIADKKFYYGTQQMTKMPNSTSFDTVQLTAYTVLSRSCQSRRHLVQCDQRTTTAEHWLPRTVVAHADIVIIWHHSRSRIVHPRQTVIYTTNNFQLSAVCEKKDEARPLVRVSDLFSLQRFDSDGRVSGRTWSGAYKSHSSNTQRLSSADTGVRL